MATTSARLAERRTRGEPWGPHPPPPPPASNVVVRISNCSAAISVSYQPGEGWNVSSRIADTDQILRGRPARCLSPRSMYKERPLTAGHRKLSARFCNPCQRPLAGTREGWAEDSSKSHCLGTNPIRRSASLETPRHLFATGHQISRSASTRNATLARTAASSWFPERWSPETPLRWRDHRSNAPTRGDPW
jgi:hypothetical protein